MKSWRLCLIVLAAFIVGFLVEKFTDEKLLNRDLAMSFMVIENDLDSLFRHMGSTSRSLDVDPANKPIIPITGELGSTATKDELDVRLKIVRSKILREIQKKSASKQPIKETISKQHFLVANGQSFSWIIQKGEAPVRLSIRNPGPSTINNLGIFLDGKKIPVSIEEIVKTALSGVSSDESKAIALWSYIVKNRTHDWPAHSGDEAFDPVKLLSVYGYGFCSHAAKALAIIANHEGLESRVRHAKSQHVVCEIMIDGRWAMFDPDGEVFYRTNEDRIASVDEIRANPELVNTARSPIYSNERLKEIFSNHDFKITPFEKFGCSPRHKILPSLRPGEELIFSKEKKGLFFASRYLEVPKEYANGTWIYRPAFESKETPPLGLTLTNLSVIGSGEEAVLKVSNPSLDAEVLCFFDLPYPAIEAKVEVIFPGAQDRKNSLQVMASRDGKLWFTAEASIFDDKAIYQFNDFPNRVGGNPDYKFWIKIINHPNKEWEGFPKFRIGMALQMAPRALPIPDTDRGNLVLNYKSASEQKIEVGFVNETNSKNILP